MLKAAEKLTSNTDLYIELAKISNVSNNNQEALQNINKALEIDPHNIEALNLSAFLKYKLNDMEGSKKDFETILKSKPNSAEAYFGHGNVMFLLDDFQSAITDYNKALQLDDSKATYKVYYNRGFALSRMGKHKEALKDYGKSIELKANNGEAWFNRGYSKFYLKDRFGACFDWSKAGELGYEDAYNVIQQHCQ